MRQRRRRLRRLGMTALAVMLTTALLPTLTESPAAAVASRSCSARASAYAAGGQSRAHPGVVGVACGYSTGYAGAESHIVVTNDGTIFFMPAVMPHGLAGTGEAPITPGGSPQSNASPAGIAVSHDDGATWSVITPAGATWNPTDHGDYVDPVTSRLFFEDYGPIPLDPAFGSAQEGPAHINVSSDDGKTWHHTSIDVVFLPENPRFTTAVAPAGQARPVGYPNVVYFCANRNVGFTTPVITQRLCFRSLDGGLTWVQRSIILDASKAVHPECGSNGESFSAIDGYYPEPVSNGDLYLMVSCGGKVYLARSTNEAATFPIVHTSSGPVTLPLSPPQYLDLGTSDLRIGPDNTFYLVSVAGSGLDLRVSHDLGELWSAPMNITPPGVTSVLKWALAQRGRQLAVSILGQRRGSSTYDGFLVLSQDAGTSARPVFYEAMLNPASRPLLYGSSVKGAGYIGGPLGLGVPFPPPFDIQLFGNDFIGATIAPDGTAWGSFTEDCGPSEYSAGCVATHDETRGFAGSLTIESAVKTVKPVTTTTPAPKKPAGTPAATGGLATTGEPAGIAAAGMSLLGLGLLLTRRRRKAFQRRVSDARRH